jgi:ubiquinone/menaquinone biosynthesis C-methylase UbiE
VDAEPWLTETRSTYDKLAADYADFVRELLSSTPFERAAFALFADQVRAVGGGPVADVGCGPGRITAHLASLGLEAFGIDLSPAMIEVARREHPGLRFEVGSMTDLKLPDRSVSGLVAWYSTIHIPDAAMAGVLDQFRRVIRPSGSLLLGFHAGTGSTLRTSGLGGHKIHVQLHRREPEPMAAWLAESRFTIDAYMRLRSAESPDGVVMFAHRPGD